MRDFDRGSAKAGWRRLDQPIQAGEQVDKNI